MKVIIKSVVLTVTLLIAMAIQAGELISVDDSYTISSRFESYRKQDPKLALPDVRFVQGQQILFDRVYRRLGKRELHLDVFKAADAKPLHPGIVLVHGGGWRSGNKSHFYALANRLAQLGYVVILPEYRLSAEARYPAGLEDINHVIVWTKTHAAELGLDLNRLVLGGASSGGQMASLLAYTAEKPLYKAGVEAADTRVAALIDLDGVLDFTDPLALASENKKGQQSAAALWLGGSYEQISEIWRTASAVSHVSTTSVPTLVISSGQLRFTTGKDALFSHLARLNIPTRYYQFDNIIHTYWLFEPYLTETVTQIDGFLQQVFTAETGIQ